MKKSAKRRKKNVAQQLQREIIAITKRFVDDVNIFTRELTSVRQENDRLRTKLEQMKKMAEE